MKDVNSAVKAKTLVLVGRDDWQRDELLNLNLLAKLQKAPFKIRWEDPAGNLIHALRKWERCLPGLSPLARKINLRLVQFAYGVVHPSYFIDLYRRKNESLYGRSERLRQRLKTLAETETLWILSRSSGGRVSSMIADTLNIRQIICLGYPFKHPQSEDDRERYAHLADLKTPMLIIQGTADPYGGREVINQYVLSPAIELFFIETDHDFQLDEALSDLLVDKIQHVLERGEE